MIRAIKNTLTGSTAVLLFAVLMLAALAAPALVHRSTIVTYASITADAIAHYKLDELSGTTATDSSGNGYTGTYSGGLAPATDSVAGLYSGTAIDFGGTTDYVDCTDINAFDGTSFTVAAWIKTTDNSMRIVSNRGTGGAGTATGWQLSIISASHWANTNIDDGAGTNLDFQSFTDMTAIDGDGHHVALTWDTTTGTAKLYVDGTLGHTETEAGLIGADLNGPTNVLIGQSGAASQYFDGIIDDVLLFDRALTPDEIATLATSQDATAPTVVSASVDSAGTTLTVTFSENVSNSTGLTIDADVTTAAALSSPTVSGDEITYTISPAIQAADVVDIDYAPGNITDSVGNALASFSNSAVANGSTQGETWDVTDSFEGSGITGWDGAYWTHTILSGGSVSETNTNGGVPSGGGTKSFEQHYDSAATNRPSHLTRSMSGATEDSVLKWDFWLKYDASWSNGTGPNEKAMRITGGTSASQLYFMSIDPWAEDFLVYLQSMSAGNQRKKANVNGGDFFVTPGNWERFVFHIKLASESGAADGYIRGWVDTGSGLVQRWQHENIHTWRGGTWGSMAWMDATTKAPTGANQKRYWDLVNFRIE